MHDTVSFFIKLKYLKKVYFHEKANPKLIQNFQVYKKAV
jgi:hypothetical protein